MINEHAFYDFTQILKPMQLELSNFNELEFQKEYQNFVKTWILYWNDKTWD